MLDPGARMSTQVPQLEKEDSLSELSVDPTVMAEVALAGLWLQALALLLPRRRRRRLNLDILYYDVRKKTGCQCCRWIQL